MLKISLSPLNIVLAGVVSYATLTYVVNKDVGVIVSDNIVELDNNVSEDTVKAVNKGLLQALGSNKKPVLLDINSPGGDVVSGRETLKIIQTAKKTVNTFSDNIVMSMGMAFFLEGKERMVTDQAIGMLHRGSAGGMSYNSLKEKLKEAEQILEQVEKDPSKVFLDQTNPFSAPKPMSVGEIRSRIEQLKSIICLSDLFFEREFERLEEIKKTAPNPEKTQAIIDSLRVGDRDIFLNAKQMVEAGIATKIVKDREEANAHS